MLQVNREVATAKYRVHIKSLPLPPAQSATHKTFGRTLLNDPLFPIPQSRSHCCETEGNPMGLIWTNEEAKIIRDFQIIVNQGLNGGGAI